MHQDELFKSSNEDSFFISFTDIVTLLLIFFIYLTTISNFNSDDIDTLTKKISKKFNVNPIAKDLAAEPTKHFAATDPWMNLHQTIHNQLLPNEAIRLSLDQNLLFKPGSATLLENGKSYLKNLALAIQHEPYRLIIEGHSDSTPINNPLFPTNWHLSSMRAAEVTAALAEYGIDGKKLSARGFGETRPIIKDATSTEDHQKNRRVQIYILPIQSSGGSDG